MGDAHAAKDPVSSLHWNEEPASVEWKVNVAVLLSTVPLGPESINVSGGVLSRVTPWLSSAAFRDVSTA